MTDTATTVASDAARAERLARLRQRRAQDPGRAEPVTTEHVAMAGSSSFSPPTVTAEIPVTHSPSPELGRRRRSPAASAKIITVGASATAMFGMIAGYGIADGLTDESASPAAPEPADAALQPVTPVAASVPPASPTTTPTVAPATTPAPAPAPQVIVVVVDGATGRTLSTTTGTGDLAADLAAAGVTGSTADQSVSPPASAVEVVPAPAPVVPTAVDLAVPAPPPPPAAPSAPSAAPAAPAPAPQPQATSSGS